MSVLLKLLTTKLPQTSLVYYNIYSNFDFQQILDDPFPRGPEIVVLTPAHSRSFLCYSIYYNFICCQILDNPLSGGPETVVLTPARKRFISLLQSLLQDQFFPNLEGTPFRGTRYYGFDPGPETVNLLPREGPNHTKPSMP